MIRHDDTAITYLYGRYDYAQRMMSDTTMPTQQRRDWAVRAEELRTCLRQLEGWRVDKVGSRYQPDDATSTEIHPPPMSTTITDQHDPAYARLVAWAARRPQTPRSEGIDHRPTP